MAEKSNVELRWEVGPQATDGQFSVNFVEFEVDVDRPMPQEGYGQLAEVVRAIEVLVALVDPGRVDDADDFVRQAIEEIEALHPNARVGGRLVFSVPIGDVDPDLRVFEWSRLEPLVEQALLEAYEANGEHLGELINRTIVNLELIRVRTRVEP